MSLQFYLGASGSGKSYKLHKDILDKAKENPSINYLFIVPDQFTMQTQKDLVLASDNKGIMNVDVLSISRLAHRIFEELGCNNQVVLDDTGKSLIIRKLAASLKDQMPMLGNNLNKIGFEHELKSIISEFKQYNITGDRIDALIRASEKKGILNLKLKDIKILNNAFDEYIKESFITTEETVVLLSNKIYESNIIKNSVVIFDGFTGFTPVQYALLEGLLKLTHKVIVSVTVDIDDEPFKIFGEQELFSLSKKTIYDLQKIAQANNIIEEKPVLFGDLPRFKNNPEIVHLAKNIFRYPVKVFDDDCENITIYNADNIHDEIKNTCILIKNMVLEGVYEYRDFAIICGDLSSYKDIIEDNARVYQLPVYIDETRSIKLNPFVEYIRSALNIIRDNFSYVSVFHFLRCGLIDIEADDIDRLDNYVIKCGIKGAKAWKQDFTKLPYKSNKDNEITSQNIEELNRLNQSRRKIISYLEPIIVKKATVTEFVEGVYEFIIKGQIKEKLDAYVEYFELINDRVRAKEYAQIYKRVLELLEQIHDLLNDEPLKMDDFIQIFDSGIEEIDIGVIPGGVDRIMVGDIERTRVGNVKVLFFLGVNDGNIPKANSKGGLISDIDREYLKQELVKENIELAPSPREQIYSQRLYLYLNMTKPSEKLYLSYAKCSIDGKTINKSYIILQILKMFPKLEEISATRLVNSFDGLLGIEDSYKEAGKILRKYSNGEAGEYSNEELQALFYVLMIDDRFKKATEELINAAFYEYKDEPLETKIAKALYGEMLKASVSRLEKFASCQYAHFLQYGLRLNERDEFSLMNNDVGNIYHGILESFTKNIQAKGYTLSDFPNNIADEVLNDIIMDLSVNYKDAILRSSGSNEYKLSKILSIMKKVINTTQNQLKAGMFTTLGVEKRFSKEINLDNNYSMLINGKVDRIDTYEDKDNDSLYVKIIDYKSGKKDIDYNALFYGLQIQQPLYMMNMLKQLAEKYSIGDESITPKMAAMLYYHIIDPIVEGNNDITKEEALLNVDKTLCPSGLVSDEEDIVNKLDINLKTGGYKSVAIPVETKKDGSYSSNSKIISKEEYNTITKYIDKKVKEAGIAILSGEKKINPYEMDNSDSCKYCAYKDVCDFDLKQKGYKKRKLKKVSKEDIFEEMKKYVEE